jgi:hypothetical protein
MSELKYNQDFKVGDMMHKIVNNIILIEKIYIILSIREKKGGNWHDGYTTEYIALMKEMNEINVMKEVFENNETNKEHNLIEVVEVVEEEYLLRYTNYMCQCDVIFAHLIYFSEKYSKKVYLIIS